MQRRFSKSFIYRTYTVHVSIFYKSTSKTVSENQHFCHRIWTDLVHLNRIGESMYPFVPMDSTSQDSLQELSPLENLSICLPHPYLTRYVVKSIPRDLIATAPEKLPIKANGTAFRLFLAATHEQNRNFQEPKFPLHSPFLSFDSLTRGNEISVTDNTQWARARRSPSFTCTWISAQAPSIGQIWLVVYFLFTAHFDEEAIRLFLCGSHTAVVREELITLGLAVAHPLPCRETSMHDTWTSLSDQEIVLLRSAFWQGAASPFGTHSAWTPVAPPRHNDRIALEKFPAPPPTQTITTKFPAIRVHTSHPVRPAKPSPGTLFYSRYIPHLNEQYSMIALDYKNPEHLELFHTWQNDPRIAAGWNETGTLEQHRTYLKNLHNDAHIVTVLACFEDIPFAYFEIYWAKARSP